MTNKNRYISFALLVLFGAGCGTSPSAPAPAQQEQVPPVSVPSLGAEQAKGPYTLAEVAKHATEQDCWMAISGKVYDVTVYIPQHKSGQIMAGCGKDATSMFVQRPDGTPHSEKAVTMLDDFYIGDLKTTP
jgi:cytochrome b involved in lipid metabolism